MINAIVTFVDGAKYLVRGEKNSDCTIAMWGIRDDVAVDYWQYVDHAESMRFIFGGGELVEALG